MTCSCMVRWVLVWNCVACPALSLADEFETEKLEVQPASEKSWLNAAQGNINDKELTKMFRRLLAPEHNLRMRDATFLFNQCFGGGFLDNLKMEFGRGEQWVGASASLHGQRAIGKLTQAEANARPADKRPPAEFIADPAYSTWTEVLLPRLGSSATVMDAIRGAETADIVGPSATAPYRQLEQPQWSSGSGGELIELADADATARHAVIWGGANGHRRHYENMAAMRDRLIAEWGGGGVPYTITMFYGFGTTGPGGIALPPAWGTRAATTESLRSYLRSIEGGMNTTTQFLFYATGHGGSSKKLPRPERILTTGVVDDDEFTLSSDELEFIDSEPEIDPTVWIDYLDFFPTSGEVSVRLNNVLLGVLTPSFEPGEGGAEFLIPDGLLASINTVSLFNDTDVDLNLLGIEFVVGGVPDNPPVPEPGAFAVLWLGLMALRRDALPRRSAAGS